MSSSQKVSIATIHPIGELNFHRNILTLLALLPSVQVHFGFQVFFWIYP
jgi:hypothetical protein